MNLIDRIRRIVGRVVLDIDLPQKRVHKILKRHEVGQWFHYIYRERKSRWDVCMPAVWILESCPKDSLIFETGCGCGFNLIWLGQQGFIHLCGSDIQRKVIDAAKELALLAGLSIDLWQDDALRPGQLPVKADVVIANWTCFDERFDLRQFLDLHSPIMSADGYLILDVIDTSFDDVPNNQYLTSDWCKPVPERKPSEYKIRYSPGEVAAMSAGTGFEIHKVIAQEQLIPRKVYIFRKL